MNEIHFNRSHIRNYTSLLLVCLCYYCIDYQIYVNHFLNYKNINLLINNSNIFCESCNFFIILYIKRNENKKINKITTKKKNCVTYKKKLIVWSNLLKCPISLWTDEEFGISFSIK